jgi:hypothetical protein
MSFKALIEELDGLEVLKKSISDEENQENGEENTEEKPDELLGKSMKMTDEDGNKVEAIDGTELIKSLTDRLTAQETAFAGQSADLLAVMTKQTDMIKSLTEQVNVLASSGRGRQSVVSIAEKPDPLALQKSQPQGMSGDEFMVKAMDANKAGRLSSMDVAVAEGSLNKGLPVPAEIVAKVLA